MAQRSPHWASSTGWDNSQTITALCLNEHLGASVTQTVSTSRHRFTHRSEQRVVVVENFRGTCAKTIKLTPRQT
ncbi:hypothetical protein BO82DRAFT_356857 [Aspergillus uvarum CBS 121591]|uniref:Uncharacterized protein n=1 Tax=Aspergillus uvarum CBS 121591 TaxID=1448315 RepID=A0A319BZA2_9EURO|nr:hypothetical protein BO82DRAFT_356857 [Aspergillus uvarum CBS 121591]PYH79066.1 hypothetical protein BO82DRAFT_356857 [Aspergillus uvarum CBS 121591]